MQQTKEKSNAKESAPNATALCATVADTKSARQMESERETAERR